MNINSIEEYNKYLKKEEKKIKVYRALILIIFLLTWELLAQSGLIDVFLFSSPSRVIKAFYNSLLSGKLIKHTTVTLVETIIAFSLSTLLGIFLGILLWYFDTLKRVLEPYLVLLNSIPKTAIAPIIIVWFGIGYKAIIIVAISIGFFTTTISYMSALNEVGEDKIKLIYVLGGNKRDVLKKIIIPFSLPSIVSICKVNIGLSLIGVIIGEFLVAQKGLGYMIIYGSQIFDLNSVILSLVVLSFISYVFYKTIDFIEKRIIFNNKKF